MLNLRNSSRNIYIRYTFVHMYIYFNILGLATGLPAILCLLHKVHGFWGKSMGLKEMPKYVIQVRFGCNSINSKLYLKDYSIN